MPLRIVLPVLAAASVALGLAGLRLVPAGTSGQLPPTAIDLLGDAWEIGSGDSPGSTGEPASGPMHDAAAAIATTRAPAAAVLQQRPLPRPVIPAVTSRTLQADAPFYRPVPRPVRISDAAVPGVRAPASEIVATASSRAPAGRLWTLRRTSDGGVVARLPLSEALAIIDAQARTR